MRKRAPDTRRAARRDYRWLVPPIYVTFVLIPIYWLINMSFKTNHEITSGLTLIPHNPTLRNYAIIFGDPSWYWGYINSAIFVTMNVAISIFVAVPAAYAFSRYKFVGDKQMFFWFLASRMMPPAVLFIPLVQLYSNYGLIDTHIAVALVHCLFTVPIVIWILEGFISNIPKELDEQARIDGYGFPRFFIRIMLPAIAPGVGVGAFFCFMFSWVEVMLANALTTVNAKPIVAIMSRAGGPLGGMHLGLLTAASVLTIIPGVIMVYFMRNYIARGFALGRSA